MQDFWQQVLDFSQSITAEVGNQLMTEFGQVQAEQKTDGSLVTQADQWADATLTQAIQTAFPEHGVLTEETSHVFPDKEWCWIVDPIDGTTNFTRGIPLWGISLGLLYQGTPVFGFVYLPPIAQTFHGFSEQIKSLDLGFNLPPIGAFLNHQPIKSSTDKPESNQFFNLCARSTDVMRQNPEFPCKIRMLGVATYNFLTIAAGIALGGVERTPKIWDIAAVWVIVQAAGGVWVSLDEDSVFPLTVGQDYAKKSYPTLVVSQPEWVDFFRPLVSI